MKDLGPQNGDASDDGHNDEGSLLGRHALLGDGGGRALLRGGGCRHSKWNLWILAGPFRVFVGS